MAQPTPTPTDDKPSTNDEWVYSDNGKARACFTHLGEGYYGDYDETDPDDAPLYRLDIEVAAEYSQDVWGEEIDGDPNWAHPADGSICTHVEVDAHDQVTLTDLLTYAADRVADALTSNDTSVKRVMDHLSYLPTKR